MPNKAFQITCPKCKEAFDAGDAFNAHFKNAQIESEKKLQEAQKQTVKDVENKYKSQLEKQEQEIEKARKTERNKATEEAEKKFKLQLEKQDQEIEKAKKNERNKATEEIEKKYRSQLENKDKQLAETQKNLEQKLKEDAEKKLELAKKENAKKAEHEAEKKFAAMLEKQKEELEKSKKSQEITQKRLEERTQEITKIMEARKVELQGEIQEERLQDFLRKKFPEDDVEEIKKGARGGDCILTINYKGRKNIAKIYFESKDTKNFNEEWANKLLNDMKNEGIANGIIVVSKSALPSDFDQTDGYVERHGNSIVIIPLVFPLIHTIVSKIRSILILKARENNDHEIPEVMKKCWANLNSPNFILPIKTMVSQIRAMETLFKKERETFERTSANKDRTIKQIQDNLVSMITSFTRNVGDIFPQDLLSYKEDNLLEESLSPKIFHKKEEIINNNQKKERTIESDLSKDFLHIIKINIHKEWSLSIKTFAALKDLDITYVGDLISYDKNDLLKARNFGNKSLEELTDYMSQYDLNFGTNIKDWNLIRLQLV